MSSIGERLREERLRRSWSLDRISEQTRINSRFLEALEADELHKLPGSFFARSFVRQYAKALGLDERQFEPELERLTTPPEAVPLEPQPVREEFDFPSIPLEVETTRPRERRSLKPLGVLIVAVLICLGLYAVWQKARQALEPDRETPPASASQASPAEAGSSAATGSPPAEGPPAVSSAQAASAQPPPPAPAGRLLIELGATDDTWVRVTSDEKIVYSGTLRPGQTKTFQGMDAVSVLTGNAGGLVASFNGRSIGPVGPKGQLRVIEFTPQGHKILERKPVPPDTF
jgi:transcriptional regulator with XRE-family HTH domain